MNYSRTVEDFFDTEYLGYAKYVVESRAIPSAIDGLKPSQRKIIFAANKIWKTGNEKPMKLFQLAGNVAATTMYHHGNTSLESALVNLAQTFKNSMPLLTGIGQFGSLRSPEAGAPRYIGAKLHPNFRLLYKDFELLESQFEDGEEIEPRYFLPIVPTVLLNGSSGIAVGFATSILNRNPLDVIHACLHTLDGKKIKPLKPWIRTFKGEVEQAADAENSWYIRGIFEVKNTTTVEITELPPSFTYEKYETHLNNLLEKGILSSYEDNCSNNINYVLKFPRQILSDLVTREKLSETLKMQEREGENLTTIDETGTLKIFKNSEEIVKYFVDFRLGFYQKRKDYLISQLEKELKILSNRARFIKGILDGKIKINKVKREDLILQLDSMKFDKVDNSFQYLIGMPIYSLTLEKYEELLKLVSDKEIELESIKKLDITEMYRKDLKDLEKKIKETEKI
jgi:DNA topoisomerase-2